jgi:hypothetical protein
MKTNIEFKKHRGDGCETWEPVPTEDIDVAFVKEVFLINLEEHHREIGLGPFFQVKEIPSGRLLVTNLLFY